MIDVKNQGWVAVVQIRNALRKKDVSLNRVEGRLQSMGGVKCERADFFDNGKRRIVLRQCLSHGRRWMEFVFGEVDERVQAVVRNGICLTFDGMWKLELEDETAEAKEMLKEVGANIRTDSDLSTIRNAEKIRGTVETRADPNNDYYLSLAENMIDAVRKVPPEHVH